MSYPTPRESSRGWLAPELYKKEQLLGFPTEQCPSPPEPQSRENYKHLGVQGEHLAWVVTEEHNQSCESLLSTQVLIMAMG